ncbi:MAG TPA: MgtC/SapB family protein, partial [Candidatus Paceibacterota bacterium]|nr:MgtC/SapB family protein [Candidatus Paceibacterota bacterium]
MFGHLSALEFEIIIRITVAVVLGACMGLERSLAGKHAGMRTYALVALGSSLFTVVGVVASYQMSSFAGINPLQIAGSVVVGIGFIGSGLAMFKGEHPVELTTA